MLIDGQPNWPRSVQSTSVSARRPHDPFDPRHVLGYLRVHAGRLFDPAEGRAERRDAELRVRPRIGRVLRLERPARISLRNTSEIISARHGDVTARHDTARRICRIVRSILRFTRFSIFHFSCRESPDVRHARLLFCRIGTGRVQTTSKRQVKQHRYPVELRRIRKCSLVLLTTNPRLGNGGSAHFKSPLN